MTFGKVLRDLLAERDMSLGELARRSHYNKGYLSRVIAGQKRGSRQLAEDLDKVLKAHGSLQAAYDASGSQPGSRGRVRPMTLAHAISRVTTNDLVHGGGPDEVPDRELLDLVEEVAFGRPTAHAANAGGRRVDMRMIEQIEATTSVFRQWDNRFGGGLRRKAVIGQLNETAMQLSGSFTSSEAEGRFLSALADLAQLAGWMSDDLQLYATAQHYYLFGLELARDARDRSQVGRLFYCLSRQMIEVGRYQDALDLAAAGTFALRRQGMPKATALLHIAEARAHARAGHARECRGSLDDAQEYFSRNGHDAPWCAFFDEGELSGLVGAAMRDLALADSDHARDHAGAALPWIRRAAESRSNEFLRSKILDLGCLAETMLLLTEPDVASELAVEAATLSAQVTSPRTVGRLTRITELAGQRFPGDRCWADATEKIMALTGN